MRLSTRSPRGPRVQLKAATIAEARIDAADHWQKRAGVKPTDEPPTGYAICDLYGACMVGYKETGNT